MSSSSSFLKSLGRQHMCYNFTLWHAIITWIFMGSLDVAVVNILYPKYVKDLNPSEDKLFFMTSSQRFWVQFILISIWPYQLKNVKVIYSLPYIYVTSGKQTVHIITELWCWPLILTYLFLPHSSLLGIIHHHNLNQDL